MHEHRALPPLNREPTEPGEAPEARAASITAGFPAEPGAKLPIGPGPAPLPHRIDLSAIFTILRITVARQSRGSRLLILAILFSLPIVIAVLTRHYRSPYQPEPVDTALVFGLIIPALAPLSALLFASGMVQDDVEEQTLTYFLIRPTPRWAIYVAKLLATYLMTVVRAVVFTLGTLLVVYWGDDQLSSSVIPRRAPLIAALLALGLGAYVAIFGALSLWVRRTLVFGAIYLVLFEGVFANIDFVIRESTVIYHIRVLAVRWLGMSGIDWSIEPATAPTASTSLIVLLSMSAVFTILGAVTFGMREFRVKTPEGN
jgi:ABC-2 type transport system permease protein